MPGLFVWRWWDCLSTSLRMWRQRQQHKWLTLPCLCLLLVASHAAAQAVTRAPLEALNPNSFGTPNNAMLEQQLWQGVTPRVAMRWLAKLPEKNQSPLWQSSVAGWLAAQAAPPAGIAVDDLSFAHARLKTLTQLGALEQAAALQGYLPPDGVPESLKITMALAARDGAALCGYQPDDTALILYCHYRLNPQAPQLTSALDYLEYESGLAAASLPGAAVGLRPVQPAYPVRHLVDWLWLEILWQRGARPIPVLDRHAPAILQLWLAQSRFVPIALRLQAAEQAAQAGLLAVGQVYDLYRQVVFSQAQQSGKQPVPDGLAAAQVWQALQTTRGNAVWRLYNQARAQLSPAQWALLAPVWASRIQQFNPRLLTTQQVQQGTWLMLLAGAAGDVAGRWLRQATPVIAPSAVPRYVALAYAAGVDDDAVAALAARQPQASPHLAVINAFRVRKTDNIASLITPQQALFPLWRAGFNAVQRGRLPQMKQDLWPLFGSLHHAGRDDDAKRLLQHYALSLWP